MEKRKRNKIIIIIILTGCPKVSMMRQGEIKGRSGSDQFTKLLFESDYKFSVPLDASVSVEVVVTRKSNTIRNIPCTVLQCPVVMTSLKASLSFTTVSTLKKKKKWSARLISARHKWLSKSGRPGISVMGFDVTTSLICYILLCTMMMMMMMVMMMMIVVVLLLLLFSVFVLLQFLTCFALCWFCLFACLFRF